MMKQKMLKKAFTVAILLAFLTTGILTASAVTVTKSHIQTTNTIYTNSKQNHATPQPGDLDVKYRGFGLGANITIRNGNGVLYWGLVRGLYPVIGYLGRDENTTTSITWNTGFHIGDGSAVVEGEQLLLFIGFGYLGGWPIWTDFSIQRFFKLLKSGVGLGRFNYTFIAEIRTPRLTIPSDWYDLLPFLAKFFPDGHIPAVKIPLIPGMVLITEPPEAEFFRQPDH